MSEEVIAVSSIAHGGAGVGRVEGPADAAPGLTWFVAGALPGERVVAAPEHKARRWIRGRLLRVLQPAPARVQPPCAIADRCGGCSWQHVAMEAQGELKRTIVADQLRDLVAAESVVLNDAPPSELGYRRRARLHYATGPDGTLQIGFFAEGTNTLVDVEHCPVLVPVLDRAIAKLRAPATAALLSGSGEVHGLTDGTHVVLALPGVRPDSQNVALAKKLLDAELVGVTLRGGRTTQTVGLPRLQIDAGDGLPPVAASPLSFAQAHAPRNRLLVRHVVQRAQANDGRVLELFCGSGNFTRALAKTGRRVWAVDEDRGSIAALRTMAEENHLSVNARHGMAANVLARLVERKTTYDVVVLDPTRRGLGQAESAHLARVASSRIVYISCDPATLARDLRVLCGKGWRILDVTVFDLMPMTPEAETVVTLQRKS